MSLIRYGILLVCFVMSCDSASRLDSPEESYFVKFYGDDGDHEGVDFISNSDGSFVILGNERVVGAPLGQQIYLVKVDAKGTVIWQRTFGVVGDEYKI